MPQGKQAEARRRAARAQNLVVSRVGAFRVAVDALRVSRFSDSSLLRDGKAEPVDIARVFAVQRHEVGAQTVLEIDGDTPFSLIIGGRFRIVSIDSGLQEFPTWLREIEDVICVQALVDLGDGLAFLLDLERLAALSVLPAVTRDLPHASERDDNNSDDTVAIEQPNTEETEGDS